MSYMIAAYSIVIGTLALYGLWVQSQRRQLLRQAEEHERQQNET